jgi:acetolactate synthase-1/2/3 large subunit
MSYCATDLRTLAPLLKYAYPPGPVCLEIPLNNQWKFGPEQQRKYVAAGTAPSVPLAAGDPRLIQQISALLLAAKRPIIVAGDGVYWSDGMADLQNLATLMQVPTNTRRTARGAVSETDPMGLASSARGAMLADADLIVLIGMRAGELESWFEAPDWPRASVKYVQINETAQELWYGLPSEVLAVGASKLVIQQILAICAAELGNKKVDVAGCAREGRSAPHRAIVEIRKPDADPHL